VNRQHVRFSQSQLVDPLLLSTMDGQDRVPTLLHSCCSAQPLPLVFSFCLIMTVLTGPNPDVLGPFRLQIRILRPRFGLCTISQVVSLYPPFPQTIKSTLNSTPNIPTFPPPRFSVLSPPPFLLSHLPRVPSRSVIPPFPTASPPLLLLPPPLLRPSTPPSTRVFPFSLAPRYPATRAQRASTAPVGRRRRARRARRFDERRKGRKKKED
jgi:hypothetical protein